MADDMTNSELWEIRVGDCRVLLGELPAGSVQCVVTSPPYWGQRDYGVGGMIGLESDVEAWVSEIVGVFRQVWRVLRDDGTLWLNLGDKYWGTGGGNNNTGLSGRPMPEGDVDERGSPRHDHNTWEQKDGLKSKDLIGLPWRVAFALQADGWYLRRDIIWHKPNPMPESATDRPSTAHEYIFLLTKKPRYFYDQDAVIQPVSPNTHARISQDLANQIGSHRAHGGTKTNGPMKAVIRSPKTVANPEAGQIKQNSSFSDATALTVTQRNMRSVWTIPTQSFSGPHYATYPEKLVEPCIKAGTSERGECPECGAPWKRAIDVSYRNDTTASGRPAKGNHVHSEKLVAKFASGERTRRIVETLGWQPTCDHDGDPVPQMILDPFSGAGTTGLVAARFGRRYIGIELNPEYAEMSRKRIADGVGVQSAETAASIGGSVQSRMSV